MCGRCLTRRPGSGMPWLAHCSQRRCTWARIQSAEWQWIRFRCLPRALKRYRRSSGDPGCSVAHYLGCQDVRAVSSRNAARSLDDGSSSRSVLCAAWLLAKLREPNKKMGKGRKDLQRGKPSLQSHAQRKGKKAARVCSDVKRRRRPHAITAGAGRLDRNAQAAHTKQLKQLKHS